jgi:hypothetical protein
VVEGEEMMQENNCLLLSLAPGLLIAENLRTESSAVSLGASFFGCSCNFPGSLKKKLCYWAVAVEDRVLFGVSIADRKLLMKMMKTETKKSPALRRFFLSFFLSPFTFKLKWKLFFFFLDSLS